MPRIIRYQGAIIRDDHILLIQHQEHASGHSYWLIPGGGIEAGETEEACVRREMLEETQLEVEVTGLLLDEPAESPSVYQRKKTYHCRVVSGEALPGYEPEEDAAAHYAIAAVRWFDLRDPATWGAEVVGDAITYPLLLRIQAALGGIKVAATGDADGADPALPLDKLGNRPSKDEQMPADRQHSA
jgi:8-oxo-dGTP diphosphatase